MRRRVCVLVLRTRSLLLSCDWIGILEYSFWFAGLGFGYDKSIALAWRLAWTD
jgi:hypothetical protein